MDALDALFDFDGVYVYVLVAVAVVSIAYYWLTSGSGGNKPAPRPIPTPLSPAVGGLGDKKQKPKKAENSGPKLRILWGSQTGTAEDFAGTLCEEAKKIGFAAEAIDLEEYDPEELAEEPLVIFVTATYGEGEPTDNAKEFYEWLMSEDRDADMMSSVKFTVFGLGNTTYEHYNAIGRAIDRRMEELGATRVYRRGEGDDDSSLEEDFLNWKKDLWEPLCEPYGLDAGAVSTGGAVEPRCKLVYVESCEAKPHALGTTERGGTYDLKNPYIAEVIVNKELHSEKSERSCRHLEILVGDNLRYEPGDHLGVYPRNHDEIVAEFAEVMGIVDELDKAVCLYPLKASGSASSSSAKPVLGPCTVRAALTELLDLTTPPRKSLLNALAQYANDPEEKRKLQILSSTDESSLPPEEQYASWVREDRRTIAEVLQAFPSVKPPLGHMLELLPALPPRYYSISSSPSAHPGHIHITSVVVDYTTRTGRFHRGVCSNHFLRLVPNEDAPRPTVPVFVRKSNFRIPREHSTPIIMVGPGTGLAPFRGFIQERRHLRARHPDVPHGENVLAFGCRHSEEDFIYQDELLEAEREGLLHSLMLAFSRETESKVYVQHKLKENADLVWGLLEEKGAHFYICGDARRMAPDVKNTLEEIVMEKTGKTKEEAEAYIARLQQQGRWSTDVWF